MMLDDCKSDLETLYSKQIDHFKRNKSSVAKDWGNSVKIWVLEVMAFCHADSGSNATLGCRQRPLDKSKPEQMVGNVGKDHSSSNQTSNNLGNL
jgi:hypothetical protein